MTDLVLIGSEEADANLWFTIINRIIRPLLPV